MKPYTVIMRVRARGTEANFVPSDQVLVYGYDEVEAVERATRVLELGQIDCARDPVSIQEGWALNMSPVGPIIN